jgi:phage baseplate assembly protein W
MATNIDFPFRIDGRGRTAQPADINAHIEELIEQLLFTNPGERVNRSNFGSGLLQSVFAPNSTELAAATQFLVQGGLQQWLGNLIQVQAVQVGAQDSQVVVTVQYKVRSTQTVQSAEFTRGI